MTSPEDRADSQFEDSLRAFKPSPAKVDLSVLDRPEASPNPVNVRARPLDAKRPRSWRVAGLSYCAGLAMGVAIMVFLQMRDTPSDGLAGQQDAQNVAGDESLAQNNVATAVQPTATAEAVVEDRPSSVFGNQRLTSIATLDLMQDATDQMTLTPRGFLTTDGAYSATSRSSGLGSQSDAPPGSFDSDSQRYNLRRMQQDMTDPANWVL